MWQFGIFFLSSKYGKFGSIFLNMKNPLHVSKFYFSGGNLAKKDSPIKKRHGGLTGMV
jgi:hypothetical protein